jgi:hypothetical protein
MGPFLSWFCGWLRHGPFKARPRPVLRCYVAIVTGYEMKTFNGLPFQLRN